MAGQAPTLSPSRGRPEGRVSALSSALVLELHGTIFRTTCLTCSADGDMRDALDRVAKGEADPMCLECGGILKSATVSFGQPLDQAMLARARRIAEECDLMLAVGSSLGVHPAAGLVGTAAPGSSR